MTINLNVPDIRELRPRITVFGVGGAGGNAVNNMITAGLDGVWLSLDPKPVHHLNLNGLSLITPNRKEAFELEGVSDGRRAADPLADASLMRVADDLLTRDGHRWRNL